MQLGNISGPLINSATQLDLVVMTNSLMGGGGGDNINWVLHAENVFSLLNKVYKCRAANDERMENCR